MSDFNTSDTPNTNNQAPNGQGAGPMPGGPGKRPMGPPPGGPGKGPVGPPPGIDPVSGAINLSAFAQEYAKTLASKRYQKLAMWFIDIRNFRSINPKYGFLMGNSVLQTVAKKTKEMLSRELPTARLGGDRFIVLTDGLSEQQAIKRFDQLTEAINLETSQLGVNQHIMLMGGFYRLRPIDYNVLSYQQPLDYASIAHRNARGNPKRRLVPFTNEDLERDMRRITIEQTIDEALESDQIEVWYQPQIDYSLGEVIGAEALARWHHPAIGWIEPDEFVPVLENCGKIHTLDGFIWEEACRSAGRWRNAADGKPVPISVNVSRTEIFEPNLLDQILELCDKYDLPSGSIRLELSESAFLEDEGQLNELIDQMHTNDLLIEMDDFGTGHSSLNMLEDAAVDVVKLDMSFMRSATNEERSAIVLGSVIRMLQGLDTPIIAEGVETLEQAEALKNMGCHLMQGNYFSQPMPLDDFEDFIASNRTTENAERRERKESHLDELMSIDPTSSFIFNNAIGGTMFFFVGEDSSECIMANDQFYRECGLTRSILGEGIIDPLDELDPESLATMRRASEQAREQGAGTCIAQVRRSQRWIECVLRYLDTSSRGDIFSINIIRSGSAFDYESKKRQALDDLAWDVDLLGSIVPNGFVKCKTADALEIAFISPQVLTEIGLSQTEFAKRFHNSLREMVLAEDHADLDEAIAESQTTGKPVPCDLGLYCGYGTNYRNAHAVCRVHEDDGQPWLYVLFLFYEDELSQPADDHAHDDRASSFVYDIKADQLVIEVPQRGQQEPYTHVREGLTTWLDSMPALITKASAAKLLAIIRDLHNHPIAGFTDIKCSLSDSVPQRWFHLNYTCDVDRDGNATIIRGFAHDANDRMGSTKWWRQQAEIDQLTGLLNRNAVEQSINLAVRTQGTGMMFMIDLDGFKRVNDELGHLAGDALLRDVAHAIDGCFRENDVIGRYGGDEFVAFMSIAGGDAHAIAAKRAQRIIEAVEAVRAEDMSPAACSVGVAITDNRNTTFYELLEVADRAMYQSKESGKGTYTVLDM